MGLRWKSAWCNLAVHIAIIAGTGTSVLGCANSLDLVREGTVTVQPVSSRYARVSRVDVVQIGSNMRIYGELDRLPLASRMVPGHVEIVIVGPEGALVAHINDTYHRKDKRYRRLWFLTEIAIIAQPGSRVRVIHVPLNPTTPESLPFSVDKSDSLTLVAPCQFGYNGSTCGSRVNAKCTQ